MSSNYRSGLVLVAFLFALIAVSHGVVAQENGDSPIEDAEITVADDPDTTPDTEEEIRLTDEEVEALMTRVDRFFLDQDMVNLTVDVDIYRDPSRRLNEQNIRSGDPSSIAGLSTIISHFTYQYPEFYELKIMGSVLAGSEVPEDQTFFSQLLPMPGAPIFTEDIRERFFIRFDGFDEVEDRDVYRIRYSALDREAEFFDYIVYFIDIEHEVILRVESAFDNVWYVGTGRGNYYYDEWMGKYVPIYGHGTVLFYPNRSYNVWGRWYRWDWDTAEEAGLTEDPNVEIVEEEGMEAELNDSIQ